MTTTLDCNMRCYYCYQKDGQLESMSEETCDLAIDWVRRQIDEREYPSVHIDWYGGEPMLNQGVIERFSAAMIPDGDSRSVAFRGSMICNGTMWPADAIGFAKRNRITSIQFSVDGPERHHNKRRGTIDARGGAGRDASFAEVTDTIDRLIGAVQIYMRINVDPFIGRDCLEMVELCATRGWLAPDFRFYPYLAVINAMTEHCGFIGKSDKFRKFEAEFDQLQRDFNAALRPYRDERTLEVVQYYPNRVSLNCAAVNHNSVVFGPGWVRLQMWVGRRR